MSQIRFLVDEDTNPALAKGLRARQPDIEILVVGEGAAPPRGTKDPEILHCPIHSIPMMQSLML